MIRRQSVLLLSIWLLSGALFIVISDATGWCADPADQVASAFAGIATGPAAACCSPSVSPVRWLAAASRDFAGPRHRTGCPGAATADVDAHHRAAEPDHRDHGRVPRQWLADPGNGLGGGSGGAALDGVGAPRAAHPDAGLHVHLRSPARDHRRDGRCRAGPYRQAGRCVYERSEIGRLQNGFNRMVVGLQERDRIARPVRPPRRSRGGEHGHRHGGGRRRRAVRRCA